MLTTQTPRGSINARPAGPPGLDTILQPARVSLLGTTCTLETSSGQSTGLPLNYRTYIKPSRFVLKD